MILLALPEFTLNFESPPPPPPPKKKKKKRKEKKEKIVLPSFSIRISHLGNFTISH